MRNYKIADFVLSSADGFSDKLERLLATQFDARTTQEVKLIEKNVRLCLSSSNYELDHCKTMYISKHLKGCKESRGFTIIEQGTIPRALYFVLSGSVLLLQRRDG